VRLLVIGATGVIGRHVRDRATADGMEVITAARAAGAADVRLDLTGPDLVEVIADVRPDAVVNCGGVTQHGDAAAMVAVNVVGVARLQAALAGSSARLIQLGSAAEYGEALPGTSIAEDAAVRPAGPYGITKLAGTELVRAAVREGFDACVLRIFNPVGPGVAITSLPGRLAHELRAPLPPGEPVRVGPLSGYRDFVDLRDVAAAIVSAACAPGPLPPVLNVGSGRAIRMRELAGSLVTIAGGARPVMEDPDGSAGVGWSQADISLITRTLGWTPVTDLTTSLWDMWEAAAPSRP